MSYRARLPVSPENTEHNISVRTDTFILMYFIMFSGLSKCTVVSTFPFCRIFYAGQGGGCALHQCGHINSVSAA